MAKSASDSDPDSKPVSSLFWRSREGGEEDEAERFAKRPHATTASVKQENRPDEAGSYDIRFGQPQMQMQPMQQPSHHPLLSPLTGPAAAVPSTIATSAARRPIQQYPAEVWETHKAHLHHLYIQQGKSLKQIQQIMAQRGFNASDKMYKDRFSKWGFRKNRRALTREKAEAYPGGSSNSSSLMHANHHHYRGSSSSGSGSSIRAAGMMHAQDCYAHFLATATTPPRLRQQQQLLGEPAAAGSLLPLAYFQDALYDNRPRLPDTYLVQDQLLRCFDGMAARAWATGEVRPGDTNKMMYVTPEVHRRLVRLFDVDDYISTLKDETPHCRASAAMRPGYESVSTFLKNPSLFGLLRLLQLTMYAGPNTQLPVVWRYIAHSPQLRHCSVPGLYELCQNMARLIGSYPPGSRDSSPFVELVINTLPRLEAMVPLPTTASDNDASAPWTPTRKLRDMLRRLLLATSHRQSLSEPLKRYAHNSELLVRELLEVLERGNNNEGQGQPQGRWHVCEELSAALPKEVRVDLVIFGAFKRADENGNCLWGVERERQRQKLELLATNTTTAGPEEEEQILSDSTGNDCNARLGLAIALRRQAMHYITGMEQREHGERFEDLKALEAWYREVGDAAAADEAVRQGDLELERHLATLTL
ncbi:hypothetical protein PG994_000923 [Apiospora phragmitis]|uniref:Clr5 domain-containing protein n=1 Tax=Apiospora phragmitis TaxID=2905665 RepID=A0ABR1WQY4_9PEZI